MSVDSTKRRNGNLILVEKQKKPEEELNNFAHQKVIKQVAEVFGSFSNLQLNPEQKNFNFGIN